LFRAESFGHAVDYFAALAGAGRGAVLAADYLTRDVALALLVGAVACLPAGPWLRDRLLAPGRWAGLRTAGWAAAEVAGCSVVVVGSALCLAGGTYQPFLYFRF
jgi:hypothetical protein